MGSVESRKNPDGNYPIQVLVLPASALLNDQERAAVSRHLDSLRSVLESTPENNRESAKQTLVLITKMMLALPSRKTGEAGVEATGEAYAIALEDIPTWAVAAALRRWYRKECGPNYDSTWRPSSGDLRELSLTSACVIKWRIMELQRLLTAETKVEFSERHCAKMREKIATASIFTAAPSPMDRGMSGEIHDGKHGRRVMAELAAKKSHREAAGEGV